MRYLGGKSRIAKQLATRIRELVPDAGAYWDPFCGGLSMSVALSEYAPVLASDACAPLIALYQAVRGGWVPPTSVTEAEWRAAKTLPDSDPLKAFCGFPLSYGTKWFTGYQGAAGVQEYRKRGMPVQTMNVDPCGSTAKGLKRDVPRIATFAHLNWLDVEPRPLGCTVLYLDPPYAGTTGYAAVGPFDHERFYARVREWCAYADTFVSEYAMPIGYECWARKAPGSSGLAPNATERLYYLPKGSRW